MMNDDGKQDDSEDTGEAVGSRNDERISRLDAIANSADGLRDEELVDITGDEEVQGRQAAEETAEESEESAPADAPQKFKIKVNGNEIELTHDELIARASKVEAADQYLAHAKRMAEQGIQQPSDKTDAEEYGSDDLAQARALQMGTEEEAAAVIAKIRKSPSDNTDVIATRAADRIRFEDARAWLHDEYKDIVKDPNLWTLFIEKDTQMVEAGDRQPYKQRYSTIGEELRKWHGTPKGSFEDKRALKSATVHKLPTAAARATQPVEEEPDDSPSAVIAQMAQRRGQANI